MGNKKVCSGDTDLEAQSTPGLLLDIIPQRFEGSTLYKVTLALLEMCPSASSSGRWRELFFVQVL